MGVYIKGMEMPKNCLSGPLQGGTADCRLTQKTYNWGLTERPADCPLVPVPPHGRLIDADALMAKDRQVYRSDGAAIGIKRYIELYEIDDAPTIIEAEEG